MSIRSLWAMVQDDPAAMRKTNGWLALFWMANFPPVIVFYLLVDNETFQRGILLYITLVSIWANTSGHWSAWQAARVEVKQEEDRGAS